MITQNSIERISREFCGGIGGIDSKPFILGLFFLKAYSLDYWNKLKENLGEENYRTLKEILGSDEKIEWLWESFDFESPLWGRDSEEKEKKRRKIISMVDELDLSSEEDLGNAYQHLIALFASNPGRYGGEYYTPQCIVDLLSELILFDAPKSINKIYDPTCGTAGALVTLYKKCLKLGHSPKIYGQELNKTTKNMALGNCVLSKAIYDIALGDTLREPGHINEKFDLIISNPPYSCQWEQLPEDPRFKDYALAPKSKSDLAFVLHCLHSLEEDGVLGMILFPGVLYRGASEQKIRKKLVEENLIDCIISLPENSFLNTSISTNLVIFRKNKKNRNILFIEAKDLFTKVDRKAVIEEQHIKQIVETYGKRESIPGFSKVVEIDEILQDGDFTLSPPTYVEKIDNREKIDMSEICNNDFISATNFILRNIQITAFSKAVASKVEPDIGEKIIHYSHICKEWIRMLEEVRKIEDIDELINYKFTPKAYNTSE